MTKIRTIGILTGGGDVPGLNSCIRALTLRAVADGNEVLGIRRGWGGLLEIDPGEPGRPIRHPARRRTGADGRPPRRNVPPHVANQSRPP